MYVTHLSNRAIFTESETPDRKGFINIVTTAWNGEMVTNIDSYLYSTGHGQCTREDIRHPHSNWPLIAFRMHHEHVKATHQELLHMEKLPYWLHVAQGLVDQVMAACLHIQARARCAFQMRQD